MTVWFNRIRVNWSCEKCSASGVFNEPEGVERTHVFERLKREHANVSPGCEFDDEQMHLRFEPLEKRDGEG